MSPAVPEGRSSPSLLGREAVGRAAFDAIVNACWEPILRFFWRGVSLHDAEELAQHTFVRAYRATVAGGGPDATDHVGWRRYLFTCARHVWIDHARRNRSLMPLADDVGSTEPAASGPGFIAELLHDEEVDGLRACLDGLLPELRSACLQHFFDGLSKREIGRLLDRPESTVRNVLTKALAMLRQCLAGKGLAPEPDPSHAAPIDER